MTIRRILLFAALLVCAGPAFAYLDPGTGSMLLQLILGGFAAVGVVLKLYWHRLRAALGFRPRPETEERAPSADS